MEGKKEFKHNRSDKKHHDSHKDKDKNKRPPRVSPYNWDESQITSKTVVPEMPNASLMIVKPDFDGQKKFLSEIISQIDELKKQKRAANGPKNNNQNQVDSALKQKIDEGFKNLERQNAQLKVQTQINKKSNDDIIMAEARLEFLKKREDDIFAEMRSFQQTIKSSQQDSNLKPEQKPATAISNKDQEKIVKIQKEIKVLESKLAPFKVESAKSMKQIVVSVNSTSKLSNFDPAQMSDESYAQVVSIINEIEALKKKESKVIRFSKPNPKDEKDQENKKPANQKKHLNEKEIKEQIEGIKSSVQFDKLTPEQFNEVYSEINNLQQQLKFQVMLREVRDERKQVETNLKHLRDASHKSFQLMKSTRVAVKQSRDEIEQNKNIRIGLKPQNQISEQEDNSDDPLSQQIQKLKQMRDQNYSQFGELLAQYDDQQDLVKYIKFVKHKQYLLRQEARQQIQNS